MSMLLSAFKLEPYDLEPVFTTWTNGPIFEGNSKKDIPVDDWLDKIQAGCQEREIPEEYWYKVAQHFMGPKAKARLDELKAVIVKVHGGKYRWNWKKFKVAMQSMGWGIDAAQKETVQVSKTSNSWWIRRKVNKDVTASNNDAQHSTPLGSTSFWTKKGSNETTTPSDLTHSKCKKRSNSVVTTAQPPRPMPPRSSTGFWPIRRNSKDDTAERPPLPPKFNSETAIVTAKQTSSSPSTSDMVDSSNTTTTTEAPLWLLNACSALEYITSEHPKAMSIISAILITAGSIPAIPAISAGAGGAILASGTAHAIGAIAVGVGQALSMSVKNQPQNQNSQVQSPSTSR